MTTNIKFENGKLSIGNETIEIKEMEDNITKLKYEKVGWISMSASIGLLVALFNIFVIGQLNSFRNELNSFRNELNSFRNELNSFRVEQIRFENSINSRFDKLEHRMDLLEEAIIASNKRSDALFQELINLKTK